MPELPEVQTTVDGLNRKVRGRRIVGAWYDWPRFKDVEKTKGYRIERVGRRGKNILFYLGKHILLVHMKMTGHLLVGQWEIVGRKATALKPKDLKDKDNSYVHFILTLDSGVMIGFSDLRKFGKVVFGLVEKIETLSELQKLGPEANEASLKEFTERVRAKRKTIYQTLMDQTVVAGIGNIYVSEILWKAKVHPLKPANKLEDKELKALHKAAKEILSKALKLRGTSTADYRDIAGKKGNYGKVRMAYGREGEPCFRCGTEIKRQKQGGRSAYYCPECQPR
ncbi:MAG: bifunctional DNA-formamidopyrimidine glycosylase/DNA-(apurinic or apyrimidinic site) lyase [Patescibacteria group bacterium]